MKKLFATLAASAMLVPAIASAQMGDPYEDAMRRGVCGADVRPVSAEYADIDGVTHLKVACPRGMAGPLGGAGTLTPTAAGALGIGALGLGLAVSGDDETGTTTTTTTN